MTTEIVPPPEWFKINTYSGTQHLNFEGWRKHLSDRAYLKDVLGFNRMLWFFDERFKLIQEAPFYELGLAPTFPLPTKTVYPLTLGQAVLLGSLVDDSTGFFDSCDDALKKASPEVYQMQTHIAVDLNASIGQLKADFAALVKPLLRRNREAHPRDREAGITTTVVSSWHKHQILPYIDLWLWHRRHKMEMPTQETLSVWLFKDAPGDNFKIRETEKKAMEALQPNALRRLALGK